MLQHSGWFYVPLSQMIAADDEALDVSGFSSPPASVADAIRL
jgi:hypothetical protein